MEVTRFTPGSLIWATNLAMLPAMSVRSPTCTKVVALADGAGALAQCLADEFKLHDVTATVARNEEVPDEEL